MHVVNEKQNAVYNGFERPNNGIKIDRPVVEIEFPELILNQDQEEYLEEVVGEIPIEREESV